MLGGSSQPEGCVILLNGDEHRILIDSLVERHSQISDERNAIEQLIRRVTGSITEYMNEVGQRPMKIDDFDTAILAINDGNFQAFSEAYKNTPDKFGELLIHAAGRPGTVGKKMTIKLLKDAKNVPNDLYLTACKKAIDTGDANRVYIMVNQSNGCRVTNDQSVHSDLISYAMHKKMQYIAQKVLDMCTPKTISEANPSILVQALNKKDFNMARMLINNGIDANQRGAEIINTLSFQNCKWYFKHLVEEGMNIDSTNYSAMKECIRTDSLESAKLLLDMGMDFEKYTEWANESQQTVNSGESYNAINEYWKNGIRQEDSGIVMTQ